MQLCTEIKGIICNANQFMKPFLKIFVVEEGNGLSPFSVYMDTPAELINIIEDFFQPPKRDIWNNPKNEHSTNLYDNGDSE